jgi:hypothetical protein
VNTILNVLIIVSVILTFFVLIVGLVYTARSGDRKNNKINLFMRYRVLIQFVSLVILTFALYLKS